MLKKLFFTCSILLPLAAFSDAEPKTVESYLTQQKTDSSFSHFIGRHENQIPTDDKISVTVLGAIQNKESISDWLEEEVEDILVINKVASDVAYDIYEQAQEKYAHFYFSPSDTDYHMVMSKYKLEDIQKVKLPAVPEDFYSFTLNGEDKLIGYYFVARLDTADTKRIEGIIDELKENYHHLDGSPRFLRLNLSNFIEDKEDETEE